jgi:MFS transporter, DHA1 family, inner membrane transport protein
VRLNRPLSPAVAPVAAMAVGAFAIGLTEFAVIGLLPAVAADFTVSVPAAGALVTAYALGVVIGAPILTVAGARLPRRTMLIAMMAFFALSNAGAALSPSFEWLVAARFLSGLPHGAFFGVASLVAARLAGPAKRASAVAWLFTGLTCANLVGVPGATALGTAVGWRAAFVAIGAVGLVCVVAMLRLVPGGADSGAPLHVRAELRALCRPAVLLMLAMIVFGCGGLFTYSTYLAPMITDVAGFDAGAIPVILGVLGLGMTVGTIVGGWIADRLDSRLAVLVVLATQAVILLAAVPAMHVQVLAPATVFLVGAVALALAPVVQTVVMDTAAGAPAMASAGMHSAFNIANAIGSALGGVVIASGLGIGAAPAVGAALAAVGAVLAAAALVSHRRQKALSPAVPAHAGAAEVAAGPPRR